MINTKEAILAKLQENQATLIEYGVRKIGLFGSFTRAEQHPASDVDLLVEFEPGQKTFDNFMGLAFFLEEMLERPVELVTTEALSPYIGPHIVKEVEYVTLPR